MHSEVLNMFFIRKQLNEIFTSGILKNYIKGPSIYYVHKEGISDLYDIVHTCEWRGSAYGHKINV